MKLPHTPLVLIILDGWGYREKIAYNAILNAKTPHWDQLWDDYAHTLLTASGEAVGLPQGQMGNSEVGHLNMGAGRLVYQDFTRIEKAIMTGEFFTNETLIAAIQKANKTNKAIHIIGLLSPGGVHSHEHEIHAMVDLAAQQKANQIYVHAFLDGRDTPPKSAMSSLENLENKFKSLGRGQIASLIGRYYAMDRDKRWERTATAYHLLADGIADYQAMSAEEGLAMAYARGETDEFVKPTSIHGKDQSPITINDGDVVIFMNFRADRARQLTHAFTDIDFKHFHREKNPQLNAFVTLTEYALDINASVAFKPQELTNGLGEYLSSHGLRQLRIAETEKYAHVTFFFNGGVEKPFPGEERVLIPSPKIATYDHQPEMSAISLTEHLVAAIQSKSYEVIICNFANPDMVGHTGDLTATIKAIECIDDCLGKIYNALLAVGGEAIITADHGNAECMYDEQTMQPHTAHTSDPVPFIYIGRKAKIIVNDGALSDVAPTFLSILNMPIPHEMTGKVLLSME